MNCPVDGSVLQMTDRQGIEIDYCPRCRGVWLDRGELDKLIERSVADVAVAPAPPRPERRDWDDDDDRYRTGGQHPPGGQYPRRRKKKSFLEDIFDFG